LTKRKGKGQRPYYAAAKESSRGQYQDFVRSPKADEPSEEIPVDYGNDSGQVTPLVRAGSYLMSYAPPPPSQISQISLYQVLKIVFWVIGIIILIGGILWGAFQIVHDVKDVEESLAGMKTEMKTMSNINNGMKAIQDKLIDQDKILNELVQQKRINEILQKQSSKIKPSN